MRPTDVRRYLLAQMNDEERAEVEQRYFHDAAAFDLVSSTEDELLDEYVRGELNAADRRSWEQYLATAPDARQRLQFARALAHRYPGHASRMWWRPLLSIAATLLFVTGAWWMWQQSGAVEQPKAPIAVAPKPKPEPVVFAFALMPGTLRAEGGQQLITLPAHAAELRIELRQAPPHAKTVVFRNPDTNSETKAALTGAVCQLPAARLPNGDYIATILNSAGEELADYSFRIAR